MQFFFFFKVRKLVLREDYFIRKMKQPEKKYVQTKERKTTMLKVCNFHDSKKALAKSTLDPQKTSHNWSSCNSLYSPDVHKM